VGRRPLLKDVLDSFWEHPLSFAHCVYSRYTEYMTDMFARRICGNERQPTPALLSFRKLLKLKVNESDLSNRLISTSSR